MARGRSSDWKTLNLLLGDQRKHTKDQREQQHEAPLEAKGSLIVRTVGAGFSFAAVMAFFFSKSPGCSSKET